MKHKNKRCFAHSQPLKPKGGSPRGNEAGSNNGVGTGGGKTSKNGRGRGRASGPSPRGRSPHIDQDILGGRTPSP